MQKNGARKSARSCLTTGTHRVKLYKEFLCLNDQSFSHEISSRKQAILAREEKIDVQLKAIEDQIEENQRKKEEQTLQQNVLTNAIATPVQVTHGAK